ncbi:MAG: type II secretion system protein [Lachnospiraceae bacterium]|nr:type II secretion system protein [Lachnospiraceae bacterium]
MTSYDKSGKNSGISLIELIIVISIMAVLVGVLSPVFMKYVNKARKAKDVVTADQIARAVNTAFVENPDAYETYLKGTGLYAEVETTVNGVYEKYKVELIASNGSQKDTPNTNCFNGTTLIGKGGKKDGSTGFYGVINRELGLSTTEMNSAIIPKYTTAKEGAGPPGKAGVPYSKLDRWRIAKRKLSDGSYRLEIWASQPNPSGGWPVYRVWPEPDDIYKN